MKRNTKERNESQAETFETAEEFRGYMRHQARQALYSLVEEEMDALCGKSYHPDDESSCYRCGSAPSSVYIESRREELKRPRVRRKKGESSEEVTLKAWQLARDPEEWEQTMMRAILCGVSTRKVPQLRESELKGETKSNLSRLWQKKATELVEEVQQRDLSHIDLLVLMLDAVELCAGLVATVALAIDTGGNKHIVGYRIGSSENEEVCADLLTDLRARGLKAPCTRLLLACIDGSKALRKALLREFPKTIVQRCLVHKERNIRRYLPKKHWEALASLFERLRKSQGEDAAKEAAEAIEAFLRDKNAQARESFEEAGEELLELFRLDVPNTLNVSLLSTNCIENSFKNLRRHIGRVCRWREETSQADLWVSSGLILAAKGFRRINGVNDLPKLIYALERKYQQEEEKAQAT